MQKNIESREMDLVMGYLLKMIVQGLFLQDITKMVQKFWYRKALKKILEG